MTKLSKEIQLTTQFNNACGQGDLALVKDLLNSQESTCHIDFNSDGRYGFRAACQGGHLNVVEYLLNDTPLKEDSSLSTLIGSGYRSACEGGSLEIVQYLLNQKVQDTVQNMEAGFFNACRYGHFQIVEYLIFEKNIEISTSLKNLLAKDTFNPVILKMFSRRELNEKLEETLIAKITVNKKTKL